MSSSSSTNGEDANAPVATKTLLHGRLEFYIDRAEGLPDTDHFPLSLRFLDCVDALDGNRKDVTDPFVTAEMGAVSLFKTFVINNSLNPVWEERFNVPICQKLDNIKIAVRDKDSIGSEFIASANFSCDEVAQGNKIEGWYELEKGGETRGRIKMSIQFFAEK